MGFFSKAKIKSTEIMEQAVDYLTKKYEQAESTFTVASPFGQLLVVIANMSELIFSYISHTAEELNIQTARNHESIFGLSRLVGHDPFRGSSAFGSITVTPNTSAHSIVTEGDLIIINNFTKISISETGENYFFNLPTNDLKINLRERTPVVVQIMQGEPESQTFTSNGEPLQTFNPIINSMTDHDNVSVTVNGKEWKKVESLYDMPSDDEYGNGECFMAKSSINVGLTIIFGNGSFGTIPPAGANIVVSYIKTSGSSGNVFTKDMTVKILDSGYDEYGNEIDLNDVLDIETVFSPMLGSDYESPEFTKLIAPRTSKSFVLANPDNFVTFLSRYNQFSFIYAYNTKENNKIDIYGNYVDYVEDDNVTYLKITPNLKRKLTSNMDYFDIPTEEFYLSDDEVDAVSSAIIYSGRQLIGNEVKIINPIIRKFAINIIIRYFENANKTTIRTNIRKLLSTYFLNINRNDIIPLSDIISIVESVSGVDTCDVFFVTEKNENAKIYGRYKKFVRDTQTLGSTYVEKTIKVKIGTDPRLGFDNYGNIMIENNELYIPRGGWKDKEGNYYSDNPTSGQLGPLNIFFLDSVEYSSYNQNMQKKLTNLLKNSY